MELVEGHPLSARLAVGALPAEQVVCYGLQLAEALVHAHERGVVHRDFKSANVIITSDGRAKVLDFGLAKRLSGHERAEATTRSQASLTEAGVLAGTLAYMAPEQLCGQPADTRTDIWALGVVLYEMATGHRPFRGDTGYAVSAAILREPSPTLPTEVPLELRAVIERCLAKEPAQRCQRASEVREALGAVQSKVASAPFQRPRAVARRKRRPSPPGRASRKRIRALAVLPLENLSRDPEQEYFADGMTEALITDLSKIGALKVISRTSAMQFKGVRKPLPQIGAELGVDAVIEGSVLRVAGQVRITAQLIHAATDEHLWAESYQRELRDILALQSEVAQAIASEVRVKLTPKEKARLASRRGVNPAAYESYLKGRYFWNQRGPGLWKSIEFFEQALAEDASYARAYAGLADAFALLGFYGYKRPSEVMPKAKDAARKALELDEALAEPHASLGFVHTVFDWDWESAEKEFKRALALDPRYSPARYWHTTFLMVGGAWEEAIRELQRGLEYDPLSMYMQAHLGIVSLYAGKYEEASKQLRKALELEPNFFVARSFLGISYFLDSRLDMALRELQTAIESSGRHQWPVARLGLVYAASGDQMRALEIITELEQRRQTEYISAMDIAAIYTQLGEVEKAFEWLEKAYEERASLLFSLARFPLYSTDKLRNDPRFEALLRRIGLPEGN
jgi:TolB-like protein/Tfp pilus assembly protein PilF